MGSSSADDDDGIIRPKVQASRPRSGPGNSSGGAPPRQPPDVVPLRSTVAQGPKRAFQSALDENPGSVMDAIDQFLGSAGQKVAAQMKSLSDDPGSSSGGGGDPYLALATAEAEAQMAKYGFPGIRTPDGLARLMKALLDARERSLTLDAEAEAKLDRLAFDAQVLQARLAAAVEMERTNAQHAALKAQMGAEATALQHELELLNVDVVKGQAEAKRLEASLVSERQKYESELADIQVRGDTAVAALVGELKTKRDRKQAALDDLNRRTAQDEHRRKVIRRRYVRPVLIVGIPLLVVSNLIGDVPSHHGMLLFGQINSIWDLVYNPLREGISHTFDSFKK